MHRQRWLIWIFGLVEGPRGICDPTPTLMLGIEALEALQDAIANGSHDEVQRRRNLQSES